LYTNGYTSASASYAGTTGNVLLNDQDFYLGGLVAPSFGEYLVNIKVQETTGTGQTSLSAVTVDTVPEPSTVFLFLTGIGALGLARFRRQ
jgi:hypothetical protein